MTVKSFLDKWLKRKQFFGYVFMIRLKHREVHWTQHWNKKVYPNKAEVEMAIKHFDATNQFDTKIKKLYSRREFNKSLIMDAQEYLDNYSNHDLAHRCMVKDQRIKELEELRNEVLKVWNEDGDNGEIQMKTPIAWYRVLRLAR